jgi:glyoxylase-like metal-dependent hydrolase (beta-lactamase superfamily II)
MMSMDRRRFLTTIVPAAGVALAATRGAAAATAPAPAGSAAGLVVTPLTDNLTLISGAGGNVTVLRSPDGVLMVDGGARAHSAALLKAVRDLTGTDRVHTLFNTHWHADQIGSNATLGAAGTRIIAHENTRLWLTTDVESKWESRVYQPLPKIAQPSQTFYTSGSLEFGGEKIDYGHLGQAHTDGDIYVFFRKANVLVAGDVVSVGSFPIIDYCSNGWIGGVVTALNTLVELSDANTRIIPGFGAPQGREYVRSEHGMLNTIKTRLSKLMAQGLSAKEMIAAKPAQEFEAQWGDPALLIRNSYHGMAHRAGELGVSIV